MLDIPRITPDEFDVSLVTARAVQKRNPGNPGTKTRIMYKDIVTAFDIETSEIPGIEQACMYVWQWDFDNEVTVIGRTWDEFRALKERIEAELSDDVYVVVLVHNLSYEFQFLMGEFEFGPDDVFAVDKRKILKAVTGHLEFRCSYLHSNMSLDLYCRKMKCKHLKLSGDDFDYTETRFPWTVLTEAQLDYCQSDVVGLVEAFKNELRLDGDNLYSVPLTSTGYVRRDAKLAMRRVKPYYVEDQLPDYDIYCMLREAFRGGNTHANRFYAGMILENVSSADRSSSYPDVICNCKFPVTAFQRLNECTVDELDRLVNELHRAVIMRIALTGPIKMRDKYDGCPYLSSDKCRNILKGTFDNGRILTAEYLETTITDVDLGIIVKQYEFDALIPLDIAWARYGHLPGPFVRTVEEYYRMKTALKNVKDDDSEVLYSKAKNKLNALFGLCSQDPVKDRIRFRGIGLDEIYTPDGMDPRDILEKHNRHAFLAYQWGVWVTAWARLRLQEGIWLAGENFVYCDTDSVKYLDNIDWTKYNSTRKKDSLKSGAYADDPSGETHYMGVFEFEGTYDRFATLGAKKYVYEKDGKLEITIAGVNKKKGAEELTRNGGIEAFKPDFVFREGGGIDAIYNDSRYGIVEIDGHELDIGTNVLLRAGEYTLGITGDYARLINYGRLD